MKWTRAGRVDPAHAWGVVAVGSAGLVAIPTILATLHAADSHFRWWWPTAWMAIPAAFFVSGAVLVALSIRLGLTRRPAAAAGSSLGLVRQAQVQPSAPAPEPRRTFPWPNPAAADPGGHVFLSAAAEDAGSADWLQRDLEAAGLRVWRQATDLLPGDNQPAAIRRAITDGALVFLACFSSRSIALVKSYLNAQLLIAIDEQRMRRPDVPWLIPVRFDDCPVPDLDLGGGRTLTALATADLFGPRRDAQAKRLLAAIGRILD